MLWFLWSREYRSLLVHAGFDVRVSQGLLRDCMKVAGPDSNQHQNKNDLYESGHHCDHRFPAGVFGLKSLSQRLVLPSGETSQHQSHESCCFYTTIIYFSTLQYVIVYCNLL